MDERMPPLAFLTIPCTEEEESSQGLGAKRRGEEGRMKASCFKTMPYALR